MNKQYKIGDKVLVRGIVNSEVRNGGIMAIENKITHGICCSCGCTDETPCIEAFGYHRACYWIDNSHTMCSHCFYGVLTIPNDRGE